jgi:hypothetical protein
MNLCDGVNIGRVVYFDEMNITHINIGAIGGTTTTGSASGPSFHTFILPGETNIQLHMHMK